VSLKEDLKHRSEERKKLDKKISLWRTASRADFDQVFWKVFDSDMQAVRATGTGAIQSDQWLHRKDFESDVSFTRRAKAALDFGWSMMIVEAYKGFFSSAKKDITIDGPEDIVEKIRKNIDNMGSTIEDFMVQFVGELLEVGEANAFTDTATVEGQVSLPFTYIIPRQDILDEARDVETDGFKYYKFETFSNEVVGIRKRLLRRIFAVTPEEIIIGTEKDKEMSVERIPNQIGFVPVRIGEMNVYKLPIIDIIAPIQLDQMNIFSEIRNILSSAAVTPIVLPASAAKKLKVLSTQTMIVIPDDYTGPDPKWMGYPQGSQDAHYKYIDHQIDFIFEASRLRKQTDTQESGISRQFKWLNVTAVLNQLADQVEQVFTDIIEKDWAAFTGQTLTAKIEIDRDSFGIEGARERLEMIELAMSMIGSRDENQKELRKQLIETMHRKLTTERKNELIEEDEKEGAAEGTNFDNLLEQVDSNNGNARN